MAEIDAYAEHKADVREMKVTGSPNRQFYMSESKKSANAKRELIERLLKECVSKT